MYKLYYLVKWKHFLESEKEWVKAKHVHARWLLQKIHRMFPHKAGERELGGKYVMIIGQATIHAMTVCLVSQVVSLMPYPLHFASISPASPLPPPFLLPIKKKTFI